MPSPTVQPTYPCPACQTPTIWRDNPHRPFCSERCKMLDLGKWATESYRIPGPPAESGESTDSTQTRDDKSAETPEK